MMETGPELICAARRRPVYEVARLSQRLGNDVFREREELQPVFNFKPRGVHHRIRHPSDAERPPGVIEIKVLAMVALGAEVVIDPLEALASPFAPRHGLIAVPEVARVAGAYLALLLGGGPP